MTSTIDSDDTAQQEVRKHPIRGAIWGFFLGFGVATYLVLFAIIAFGDWIPFGVCVVAGIALGVLWASFAPPRQPKGPPPTAHDATAPEATAASSDGLLPSEETAPGRPPDLDDADLAAADPPTDEPPAAG